MFDENFLTALARAIAPRVADALRPHIESRGITPRYLNLEQAGGYLSTTPDGIRGMLRAKRFPARKLGERVFIDRNDIDAAMNENLHWLE